MSEPDPKPKRRRNGLWLAAGVLLVLVLGVLGWRAVTVEIPTELLAIDASGKPAPGVQFLVEWRGLGGVWGAQYVASDDQGRIPLGAVGSSKLRLVSSPWIGAEVPGVEQGFVHLVGATQMVVADRGSVEIHILDADGKPCRDPSLTGSSIYAQWTLRHSDKGRHTAQRHGEFTPLEPVVLEGIGVGGALTVHAQLHGLDLKAEVKGPTKRGGTTKVDLRIPKDARMITGRCVDATGTPLVGRLFGLNLQGKGGRYGGWKIVTDKRGTFRFYASFSEGGFRLTLHDPTTRTNASAEGWAEKKKPVTDVGDLRFE